MSIKINDQCRLAPALGSADTAKLPTEFRGCLWDDGWEFDAPCVIYYPRKLMRYAHGGNTGTLDDMVQDITYNLGEGLPPNDGGLDEDCKWRGWSKDGMRRRRNAWHVVFKGKWVMTEEGPEWQQTSRTETHGCPPNIKAEPPPVSGGEAQKEHPNDH